MEKILKMSFARVVIIRVGELLARLPNGVRMGRIYKQILCWKTIDGRYYAVEDGREFIKPDPHCMAVQERICTTGDVFIFADGEKLVYTHDLNTGKACLLPKTSGQPAFKTYLIFEDYNII